MKSFIIRSASVLAAGAMLAACSSPKVVPVNEEPDHLIMFENDRVEVYEVNIAAGKRSLFHAHSDDLLTIIIEAQQGITKEPGAEEKMDSAPLGTLIYTPYGSGETPYVHQVGSGDDANFHVLGLGLKGDNGGATDGVLSLPNQPEMIFPQGKALRVTLAAGEAQTLATGLAVALEDGQLSGMAQPKQVRAGQVWWVSEPTELRNEGDAPVRLLQFELNK